jgi:hypothetical protein
MTATERPGGNENSSRLHANRGTPESDLAFWFAVDDDFGCL